MSRKGTIFTQTREDTVTVSAKVRRSLKERADHLRDSVQKIDPTLSFDLSRVIQDAIEEAVTTGEKELKRLQRESQQQATPEASARATESEAEVN